MTANFEFADRLPLVRCDLPMVRGLVVVAAILGACTRANPDFCDEDRDCNNGEVCNLDVNRCVEAPPDTTCASNDECPMERPICAEDGTCRSCAADDECSSGVCRSDGICELTERILYVRPNGISTGTCPASDPCSITYARSLLSSERSTMRLADGTYTLADGLVFNGGMKVTIVGGRGAVVQRTGVGYLLESTGGGTSVLLRGFTVQRGVTCSNAASLEVAQIAFNTPVSDPRPWIGSTNCTLTVVNSELSDSLDDAIVISGGSLTMSGTKIERSEGTGVEMMGGVVTVKTSTITRGKQIGVVADTGMLVLHRSVISYNRRGGVRSLMGSFDIVNNFVYRNGDPGLSNFGGMHLESAITTSRVAHNTVTWNDCDVSFMPALSGGIYCRIGNIGEAYNNIVANNFRGNTSFQYAQTNGTCSFAYSIVAEGAQNIGCVPNSEECRLAGSGSPAVNTGVQLGVTEDVDGQPRSDGMPDVGADEFHP